MGQSHQINRELFSALKIAILWQIVVLAVALSAQIIGRQPLSLDYVTNWDGGWYQAILNGAYSDSTSAATAFYPLLPLVVNTCQLISFNLIPLPIIVLIINTASLTFAIFFLRKIALVFFKKTKFADLATLLFLTFPTAFFMGQFYTEALFCALAFAAYYFALQKQWRTMAVLLAFLTATRLPSILVVGLCGLEYLRAHDWKLRQAFDKNLAWFLLAPLGFVVYGLYLLVVRSDFFGMFHAYQLTNDWAYHKFNPLFPKTILQEVYVFLTNPFSHQLSWGNYLVNHTMPLLSLALIFAASIYSIKKYRSRGMPLGVAGLVAIVFYTLNNNIVSVHRYILTSFIIFLFLADIFRTKLPTKYHKPVVAIWCAFGIFSQIVLLYLFVNLKFIG